MVLCLGEPPRRFLWYWLSHLIFISPLYLHFRSSFCRCSSFAVFLHSHFLFDIISHTSVDYLLPFYTVSPAHRRVICNTFIFNHSVIFLPRALRFWVGVFYPQVFFTLRSFTGILPAFIKASLGADSSSLKFAGLHTNPQNTDPAHLFVWFTVIHNLHIQNNSFLNSTKYYHELLVVKF